MNKRQRRERIAGIRAAQKKQTTQQNSVELLADVSLTIQAAAGDKPSARRFEILAYTGGALSQCFWEAPVIVDYAGIEVAGGGVIPILDDHDPDKSAVVGQSDSATVDGAGLTVRGVMMAPSDITESGLAVKEILALADQGFRWQASIGAKVLQKDFIAEGNTVRVNGKDFDGPVFVSRKTVIREVSFVVIGADADTEVSVAASGANSMTFSEYCKMNDFDESKLTKNQTSALKKAHAASEADDEPDDEPDDDDEEKAKAAALLDIQAEEHNDAKRIKARREAEALEDERLAGIDAVVAKYTPGEIEYEDPAGKKIKITNLKAHAKRDGWTVDATELVALRASRAGGGSGNAPFVHIPSTPEVTPNVIEAAILEAGKCRLTDSDFFTERDGPGGPGRKQGIPERQKKSLQIEMKARYDEKTQDYAHRRYKGRIRLHEVLQAGAALNGKRIPDSIRDDFELEAAMRACDWSRSDPRDIRADGSSMASIANVVANVMNKFALQGYWFVEQAWGELCGVRPVKDFKPTKSINLFGDFTFKDIGPDGELQNTAIKDQAFANQATTSGLMLTLPRANIINDDLGMLTQLPMLLGRGAGSKLNDAFWKQWLDPGKDNGGSTDFFAATHTISGESANSNYQSGAGTALGSAGLQSAELLFDNQVDPAGKPLGIDPAILLFGPDIKVTAWELMNSEFIVYGGATASKQPNKNRFIGAYKPVMSRYINKSTFTGNSKTAWWLLADPGMLAPIEACFLNGQELPTIQTAQADFNRLGISIRGFFDFGINMQNFRGAVQSAGA